MFFDPDTEPVSRAHAPAGPESADRPEEAAEGTEAGQRLHPPAAFIKTLEETPKEIPGGTQGRFLKNPLPLPERRPHVRMEFDLADDWDIPEEEEHFDLEIAEDDDFDI